MNNKTNKITITGLCVALGVVLPIAFHTIANAGRIFLPMHIPVLLCGFTAGPIFGVLCGVLSPIISSLATGMPPVAILPAMVFELVAYGFFSGILIRVVKTKYKFLNLYIALISAMIIGRGISGFVNGVVLNLGKYSFKMWLTASFVMSLPGIFIQLSLIPILIFSLQKAKLLSFENENIWGISIRSKHLANNSKEFFNGLAKDWDSKCDISNDRIIELLQYIGIKNGDKTLDIACGTGIIDQAILNLGASKIVGIDISPNMIEIAKSKINSDKVEYISQDFYDYDGNSFDIAVVFNAYPHFIDREMFAKKIASSLKVGGKFAIIHSNSANTINSFHKDTAKKVTKSLKSGAEEMQYFEKYFHIDNVVDNDFMYLILGTKI